MAIVAPALVTFTVGQDGTITVTVPADTTGWAMRADFKTANNGTILATKTIGAGIQNTPGASSTVVITLNAADTAAYFSGGYVWQLWRTDAGFDYPITDSSTFRLFGGTDTANPTFTNLSELCAHLGMSLPLPDAMAQKLLQLLAAAEAFVHRYCGRRKFFYGTYTEWRDAPLVGSIWLTETPVWSITSINFDGAGGFGQTPNTFGTDTLLTYGEGYILRIDDADQKSYCGEVLSMNRGWQWWPAGGLLGAGRSNRTPAGLLNYKPQPIPGAFKVIYLGGYTLIPDDLRLAIWQIVADRRFAADAGVVFQSESMEGYSYSLGAPDAEIAKIGSVSSILAGYRHGETWVA